MGNPLALVLGRRRSAAGTGAPVHPDLEVAVKRLERSARVVGVILLALEPPATDEALEEAAEAARGAVRATDVVRCTGAGHLAVLLPGGTAVQVARVAVRLRDAVDAVSVGVGHGTGLDVRDLLRTAAEDLRRGQHRRTDRTLPV